MFKVIIIFLYFLALVNCSAFEDLLRPWTMGRNASEIYLDPALSIDYVIRLAKAEISVYTLLKKYELDNGVPTILERYLSDFDSATGKELKAIKLRNVWNKATHIAQNPNALLRMFGRMVLLLRPVLTELKEDGQNELLAKISKEFIEVDPPTWDDYIEQMDSIIFMHFFYELDPFETANGRFMEIQTHSTLLPSNLLDIAEYGLKQEFYNPAYFFYKAAIELNKMNPEKGFDPEKALKGWRKLIGKHNSNFQKYLTSDSRKEHYFSNLLSFNLDDPLPPTMDEVNIMKYAGRKELMTSADNFGGDVAHYTHKALCRGADFLDQTNNRNLFCYLDSSMHPFFLINPVRTEVKSRDPMFIQYHNVFNMGWLIDIWNFVSSAQITQKIRKPTLAQYARNWLMLNEKLEISLLNAADPRENVSYRIKRFSYKIAIRDELLDEHPLEKRMEMLAGIQVLKGGSQDFLRVNTYLMGSSPLVHVDNFGDSDPENPIYGKHMTTFLFFINDVTLGGGTAFTGLGFKIEPKAGDAIYWSVADTSLNPEYRTGHAGCPSIIGHRFVGLRFIRSFKNFVNRKCSKAKGYWLDRLVGIPPTSDLRRVCSNLLINQNSTINAELNQIG